MILFVVIGFNRIFGASMILIDLFNPAADQQNAHEIKTESNKKNRRGKMFNALNLRHNLRYSIEHSQTCKKQ